MHKTEQNEPMQQDVNSMPCDGQTEATETETDSDYLTPEEGLALIERVREKSKKAIEWARKEYPGFLKE